MKIEMVKTIVNILFMIINDYQGGIRFNEYTDRKIRKQHGQVDH